MIVLPFESGHLALLRLQKAQSFMGPEVCKPEYGEALAKAGPCFTASDEKGLIGCLGLLHMWEGRSIAWALLAADAGRAMRALHRGVAGFLDDCGIRRIECAVDCEFMAGVKWAQMLGFKFEGKMPAYTPDGRDCYAFARVR